MIFNCRYVKTQIGHIPPSQYCKYGLGLIGIYTNEFAIDEFILKNIWGNTSDVTQGHDLQTLTVNKEFADVFQAGKARTCSWNAFVSSISWRALFTWLDKCYHHRQNHHQHQQSSSFSSALEKVFTRPGSWHSSNTSKCSLTFVSNLGLDLMVAMILLALSFNQSHIFVDLELGL